MSRLPGLFAVLALVGCESNLISNEPLPPVDASVEEATTPPPAARRDAATSTGRRDASVSNEEEPKEEEPSGEEDASAPEVDAGGGDEVPVESKIAGTAAAAKCTSYGMAQNGMCAGFYCGVTVEDIAAELDPGNTCGLTPEQVCAGQLSRDVARCAREVRSNPLNAFDSAEQVRAKIQACIVKVPAHQQAGEECLGCYLDGAQCASDKCLTQCLTGDSATCDKCRLDNNCNQPVQPCAGLPSTF